MMHVKVNFCRGSMGVDVSSAVLGVWPVQAEFGKSQIFKVKVYDALIL